MYDTSSEQSVEGQRGSEVELFDVQRVRCADHTTPSIHKCWHYPRQHAVAIRLSETLAFIQLNKEETLAFVQLNKAETLVFNPLNKAETLAFVQLNKAETPAFVQLNKAETLNIQASVIKKRLIPPTTPEKAGWAGVYEGPGEGCCQEGGMGIGSHKDPSRDLMIQHIPFLTNCQND
uniref:Uncharacterized protein n=1 Tax=Timema cristinae TaxID=61476 RepID=A0A7R9CB75_TIMCR|nr:unnamed protein product [Timema cristinae]